MTYDFHGPWTNHAGHNSPLILSPYDPGQEGSLRTSMDLFEYRYKVPLEKLNIGTAFYGYEFDTAKALWATCGHGCSTQTYSWNYGTYIKQRVNALGWLRHYDPIAEEPYLLRGMTSPIFESVEDLPVWNVAAGFITYDDPASTARKVKYVIGDRDLGGVFMWDLSADYDGSSQDLLDAMYGEFVKVKQ
jgi:chitinase